MKRAKKKVLTKEFFSRSAPEVAKDLLGKYLIRKIEGETIVSVITETEAYEGEDDLASHASRGRTPRTEVMFGEPGRLYVYLVYGMHSMLNVVTGEKGHPSAVLIRGTNTVTGPGRLTRALHITRALNALPALRKSGLWFEDRGTKLPRKDIRCTPRIGVDYAGPIWSKKHWRFVCDIITP